MIALCLFSISTHAASPTYYFKHLGVTDGLSHQTVFSILQDKRGFMWFGTKDGLNRYDGNQFKVFKSDPKNPYALGNNSIPSLYEDEKGQLWVGTNDGVYLFDPKSERFTRFDLTDKAGEMITGAVLEIRPDQVGNIWIASSSKGLFRYHISSNSLFFYQNDPLQKGSIASGSISSLVVDSRGTVWVGVLGSGVQKYIPANETFEEYYDPDKILKNDLILDLYDHGHEILIGTKNGGLKRLTKATGKIEDVFTKDISNNPLFIRSMEKYDNNQVWICTETGIYLYNPITDQYQHIAHNPNDPYSLSDNAIYSIYQDREGGIWIGTYFGGLNYLPNQNTTFEKYYPISNINSISGSRVREMIEDDRGFIWIGTEDAGLNRFDPKTKQFKHYPSGKKSNQLNYHNIHGLAKIDNQLWVSSHSMGLKIDLIDLKTDAIQKINQSSLQNPTLDTDIFEIYEDSKGRIWLGTISGDYLVASDYKSFSLVEPLGIHFTYDIVEDLQGHLWFATTNDGLIKYDPDTQTISRYRHLKDQKSSLPSNAVIALNLDHKGQLWIGTEGGGLSKYQASTDDFKVYRSEDGLPSQVIYKIIEDDLHQLWISTSSGLVNFDPVSEKFKVYGKANGLLSEQFNYKSGLKSSDGTLYFGSLNGFVSFDPKSFTESSYVPPVVITGIKLFNKEVKIDTKESPLQQSITYTDALSLEHHQNSLSFSFAALGFTAPEAWSYAYMMEGFDKDWTNLSKNQEVSYSNLPPGNYTFRVKTGVSGSEEAQEARIQLEILPPFWKSNWAYLLYTIISLTIAYMSISSYKSRMHRKHRENLKLLEDEKEREIYHAKIEFFTSITHEIRTPLTLIKGPLEDILKHKDDFEKETQENLLIMERNSTRLIDLSNQLLDFRKTEKQGFSLNFVKTDIVLLLKELQFRFKSTAQQKKLDLRLVLQEEHFKADVDKEAFIKILSNLLSNAIKNAERFIEINLSSDPSRNTFEISVINDGLLISSSLAEKIFEPFYQIKDNENQKPTEGTGLGLPLARSLAEMHDGDLILKIGKSQTANCFVLTLPITQQNSLAFDGNDLYEDVLMEEHLESTLHHTDPEDRHKPTILIVEDNKELQKFIYTHLRSDYLILKAGNGAQALDILDDRPVDLIISDIMMPVMSGFELCKEVKSKLNYSHIPVILLTAKSNLQSKIEGLEMGADVYIEKPFSMEYLSLQVKNLIHYRDQIRQSFANSPLVLAETIAHTQADEQFLAKINQIILNNLSEEAFGVNELAESANMSQSSLLRKIKGISKLTPNEYIRLVRLKKAAEILNEGQHSITEVCGMVGFNSPSYFSKCFYKQFGELPKDFQKSDKD